MNKLPLVIGTGSFVPEGRVTNHQYLRALKPVGPKGKPVADDWLERHFGIVTRAYDAVFAPDDSFEADPDYYKPTKEQGGLFDSDFAVLAAKKAIEDARIEVDEISTVVHVTCTPDTVYVGDQFRPITRGLKLRRDVHLVPHNLGCAGLAAGLRSVMGNGNGDAVTLLLASNCPSGYLSRETLGYYRSHSDPWAWLSPAVFGDGAGALVLRVNGESARGVVHAWYETDPSESLVIFPAGGCVMPTQAGNVGQHLFLMNADAISRVFTQLMMRNYQKLQEDWQKEIQPTVGFEFDTSRIARWYLHQANKVAIQSAAAVLRLESELVPINIDTYGNTSAASTLLLFDADRRAGRLNDGDVVVFLWIGAGNGAMNGYAVVVV